MTSDEITRKRKELEDNMKRIISKYPFIKSNNKIIFKDKILKVSIEDFNALKNYEFDKYELQGFNLGVELAKRDELQYLNFLDSFSIGRPLQKHEVIIFEHIRLRIKEIEKEMGK